MTENNKKFLLGIDNGGTVAKAALFDTDGHEVAVASSKTQTLTPQPAWVEFDCDALWQASASAVRRVLDESAVSPGQIAAVACTGHGNGIYLVDDQGRPVRNAIFSADSRARQYTEQWTAQGIDQAVRPKTMQAVWPGQPNALIAWLAEHEPDSLAQTRWILMCKDFIRFRLTGEAAAEVTDMSGTSLMNVATGQYDSELLEAFGIASIADKLPPIRPSAEICGRITPEAAAATGLAPGTPVAGGLFDIDACALASALTDPSELGMTLGTWGINQYVSREPIVDGIFMTSRYCMADHFLMLEGSATSASNLEWFLDRLFDTSHLNEGDAPSRGDLYERVNREVAASDPADAMILFFPFLYGSNVSPDATATLVGMHSSHTRGDLLRAVYEGVVFGHRSHLERLMQFRPPPERIRATGGATRSREWMQIVADITQTPVEVPEGTELGALGAAICASVAAGLHADYPTACRAMVRIARRFEPNPGRKTLYNDKFACYKRFLEALAPAW